jgi:hypothetical protein
VYPKGIRIFWLAGSDLDILRKKGIKFRHIANFKRKVIECGSLVLSTFPLMKDLYCRSS